MTDIERLKTEILKAAGEHPFLSAEEMERREAAAGEFLEFLSHRDLLLALARTQD